MKGDGQMSNAQRSLDMGELDRLWGQVIALGGSAEDGDEYGRGINETVGVVLDMIEKLGGMDPRKREPSDSR